MCFSIKRGSNRTSHSAGRLGGFGEVPRGRHPAGSPAVHHKYKLPLLFLWCHPSHPHPPRMPLPWAPLGSRHSLPWCFRPHCQPEVAFPAQTLLSVLSMREFCALAKRGSSRQAVSRLTSPTSPAQRPLGVSPQVLQQSNKERKEKPPPSPPPTPPRGARGTMMRVKECRVYSQIPVQPPRETQEICPPTPGSCRSCQLL